MFGYAITFIMINIDENTKNYNLFQLTKNNIDHTKHEDQLKLLFHTDIETSFFHYFQHFLGIGGYS